MENITSTPSKSVKKYSKIWQKKGKHHISYDFFKSDSHTYQIDTWLIRKNFESYCSSYKIEIQSIADCLNSVKTYLGKMNDFSMFRLFKKFTFSFLSFIQIHF